MIKLPERYNYVEAYLTFRCNLNCSYCINKYDSLDKRKELTGDEWIKIFNNIDLGNVSLTLGGGEPTLHKDFYKIVHEVGKEKNIDLLTNGQFNIDEFVRNIKPTDFTQSPILFYHPIRISYHTESADKVDLIERVKELRKSDFNAAIFGLTHPHYINDNMAMSFHCNKAGIPFYLKDFLGKVEGKLFGFYKYPEGLDGIEKNVECRTRELLIAPDGNVFGCHRDLYHNEHNIGNLLDEDFTIEDKFRPCSNYGTCNPCDLKAKTNKYLKGVECQIEIK